MKGFDEYSEFWKTGEDPYILNTPCPKDRIEIIPSSRFYSDMKTFLERERKEQGKFARLGHQKLLNLWRALETLWDSHRRKLEKEPAKARGLEKDFFPVSSKALEKHVGRNYCTMLDFLEQYGFIKRSQKYSPGNGSKGVCKKVRLDRRYIEPGITIVQGPANKHTQRPVLRSWAKLNPEERERREYLHSVNVDYPAAQRYGEWTIKGESTVLEQKAIQAELDKVVRIKRKQIHYTTDDFGRLHTSFNALREDFRFCLTSPDGQGFADLDIRSSHLRFLYHLINLAIDPTKYHGPGPRPYVLQVLERMREILQKMDVCQLEAELMQFRNLLCHGDEKGSIYQLPAGWLFEANLIKTTEYSRLMVDPKLCKERFRKGMYGPVSSEPKQFIQGLRLRFPLIVEIIQGCKEKDYKIISYALMQIESAFVFGPIASQMAAQGIQGIYMHDGVMVAESDKVRAQQIWEANLGMLGLTNSTKFKAISQPPQEARIVIQQSVCGGRQ